jgi:hypothetical protein
MSPPIEQFRDRDAGSQGDSHDEERIRTAALLGAFAVLGPARRDNVLSGLEVLRRLAPCARGDEARFHAAKERRVLSERLRKLGNEAAGAGRAVGQTLELVRSALHKSIAPGHFFAGGCSPVATRQMRDATVRAPIVAAAPRPA